MQIIGGFWVYAGILEYLQHFSPGRHPSIADFAASALGALCGGLCYRPSLPAPASLSRVEAYRPVCGNALSAPVTDQPASTARGRTPRPRATTLPASASNQACRERAGPCARTVLSKAQCAGEPLMRSVRRQLHAVARRYGQRWRSL
jgi:hypothetical protein